ncbi:MAG: McrB family protein [Deltaproteobacteria bacterium]
MAKDSLEALAAAIRQGLPGPEGGLRPLIEGLFGSRYPQRHFQKTMVRDAYALSSGEAEDGVPFAGLVHPDNPPSGPYGGTSLVWFPTRDAGSIMTLVVGTRGLSPDEGVLTRPGHRRRLAALRRMLARQGVEAWTKPDPSALGVSVPKVAADRFPGFEKPLKRYGGEMYCLARVPDEPGKARAVVQAFLDLYAYERGFQPLKESKDEFDDFHARLRDDLFPSHSAEEIDGLLRRRRFVVLQGPPGTGKTRLADELRARFFDGRGMTVQFHPAVTYEDFVVGLSPDPKQGTLRFDVRRGWLLDAVREAKASPYLLVIDEVNRADLGKVLGEAIYLFEAGEVGGARAREVRLPHPVDGKETLSLPENLYVLATMNTADRSIASMDLAVRRRFAFVTVPPDRRVVAEHSTALGLEIFDRLSDVFVEHAPDDALDLFPGHAYFLAKSDAELKERLHYELLPLLDEYLRQGFLGAASTELCAVRDAVQDQVASDARPA